MRFDEANLWFYFLCAFCISILPVFDELTLGPVFPALDPFPAVNSDDTLKSVGRGSCRNGCIDIPFADLMSSVCNS